VRDHLSSLLFAHYNDGSPGGVHVSLAAILRDGKDSFIHATSDTYLRECLVAAVSLCEEAFESELPYPIAKTLEYPVSRTFEALTSHRSLLLFEESLRGFPKIIRLSESIPRTIAFLSATRDYLERNYMRDVPMFMPPTPPDEVMDEIVRMYATWDRDEYLDLTGISDVRPLRGNVIDEQLVAAMTFIIGHEYGHLVLLLESEGQRREALIQKVCDVYVNDLSQGTVATEWVLEHLADIYGLKMCLACRAFSPRRLIYAASLSFLVALLVENYFIVGTEYDRINPHPPSSLRLYILAKILFEDEGVLRPADEADSGPAFLLYKLRDYMLIMNGLDNDTRAHLRGEQEHLDG
jgi:hypothetical protein